MPWFPLSESNLTYNFNSALAELSGSVVSTSGEQTVAWTVAVTQSPTAFRVTPLVYSRDGAASQPALFSVSFDGSPVTVPNAGNDALWMPNPTYLTGNNVSGITTLGYVGAMDGGGDPVETFAFQVEVFIEPQVPQQTLGRVFTCYPSAYSAAQNQPRRVRRFQSHTLKFAWNGYLVPGDLITAVRFDCTSPWALYMSEPLISDDQRSCSVRCNFNFGGLGAIKCTIETQGGDSANYQTLWTVIDQPLFPSANYDLANGPFYVTATYP